MFDTLSDQDKQVLITELSVTRGESGEPLYTEEIEFFLSWANTADDTLRRMVLDGKFNIDVITEKDRMRVALFYKLLF